MPEAWDATPSPVHPAEERDSAPAKLGSSQALVLVNSLVLW